MPDLALSDLQGLENPAAVVTAKGESGIALSDMDKMGQSDPAAYVPPPPQKSVLDRLKNDVVKPVAEIPQFIGQSMQWLGESMRTDPELKKLEADMPDAEKNIFNRLQDFAISASAPADKLANRITQAGLLLQENNKSWVEKNYPTAPPDFLDRVVGGVPMLGEGFGLAALVGLPNALKIIAGQIGLQSAAESYTGLREQNKDPIEAGATAFPVGVANGLAANTGFHMFNTEVGSYWPKIGKTMVNAALGIFAQNVTSGVLDLSTGIKKYSGIEDLTNILSEATLNAGAMGVLMGGVGHTNAMKDHNAMQKVFQDIGMPADKAREAADQLMQQSAHTVMDWVQSKVDATPEQQARVMFLRPDAVQADRDKFDRFVAGTPLDSDFLPTEQKNFSDTEKLRSQVAELENTKQQISDLNEVVAGKTRDEQLQKQILKEQKTITQEVNDQHDQLLEQHVQEVTKQQKDIQERQQTETKALAQLQKENDKALKKDPTNTELRDQQGYLREQQVALRDKFSQEKQNLTDTDQVKRTELEKTRDADLQTKLQNLPTFQKATAELNRLASEKARIQGKIDILKEKLTSGPTKMESLKQEIRRLEQGFRKGKIASKDDIKSAQRQVSDLLKSSKLEAKDKAKFLDQLRQVDSSEKLQKLLPEIKNKIGLLEQRAQQDKWGKELNDVKKKVLPKLLVKDQDALKPVLDSFDFSRRSRGKVMERKATLEWFRDHLADPGSSEHKLPRAQQMVLDMAAAKSFSEMDHGEIEAVYHTIMAAVHEAKIAAGQDAFLKGENYRAYKQKALDHFKSPEFAEQLNRLEKLDNLARENVKDNRTWKERLVNKLHGYVTEQKLPELLYDLIGRRDIFERMHDLYQTKTEEQRKRMVDLARIFWDVDISKMYDPIEVKDLKFGDETISYEGKEAPTKAKLLDIYANSFDEDSRLHLVSTFGEAKANALVSWVEENMPKEAKAAQRMFDYYRNTQGPRLDAAVVEHEGHHMNQVYYYNPTGNSLETRGARNIEEDAKFGSSGMSDRALPVSGFTKARQGSKLEFEHFDYFDKIMKNLLDSENYIQMYGAVRDANRLFYDPEYMAKIKDALGNDFLNILQKSLRDVAYDGHQYDGQSGQLMRYLRKNFVYAKIGWNVFSAGKVLSQLSPAATYVDSNEVGINKGGLWVHKAIREYAYDFQKIDKFIDANSLQMKNRYLNQERETVDMINSKGVSELMPMKAKEQYIRASMAMHQWVDRFVTRVTWKGAYDKTMAENEVFGGTHADAVAAADRAVRRTHPMGQALYLPDIFRGNEWQKTLTTFHNATNRNLNLQVESFEKQAHGKQEWYDTAGQFLGYALLPAIWLSYMSLRRPPDAKEYIEEVANQSIGSDMYFGLLTSAVVRGKDAGAPYAVASTATDVAHLFERQDKLGPLAAISEDFSGIPVTNAGRILTGQMFKAAKKRK